MRICIRKGDEAGGRVTGSRGYLAVPLPVPPLIQVRVAVLMMQCREAFEFWLFMYSDSSSIGACDMQQGSFVKPFMVRKTKFSPLNAGADSLISNFATAATILSGGSWENQCCCR